MLAVRISITKNLDKGESILIKNMSGMNEDFVHGESYHNGVMMNNDEMISIVIRKENGCIKELIKKEKSLTKKYRICRVFLIRGIVRFFEGSVNQFYAEEQMKKMEIDDRNMILNGPRIKKENVVRKTLAIEIAFLTVITGAIVYFILPTIITFFIKHLVPSHLLLNVIENSIRVFLFLFFFYSFILSEKANRTVFYHGAEHKSLWCHKNGEDLTIENARKYPIYHPSCGTGLLILTILLSIPFFFFIPYENILFRIFIMVLLLPLMIGLAFELLTWAGNNESPLARLLSAPGLWLQKLNVKEPNDQQLEVALVSLINLNRSRNEKN